MSCLQQPEPLASYRFALPMRGLHVRRVFDEGCTGGVTIEA
ncbi:MAG TPA: hypothetical protein VFA45_12820 [Actinomycetes bacterium]|jgi:hypothetical protein|nr:hypothetical protein [Actinomycetes bacterium]